MIRVRKHALILASLSILSLLLVWLRALFLSVPFPPGLGKPDRVATGLFWREWSFRLKNQRAAEEFISFYHKWAVTAGQGEETHPRYGSLRQWSSFVDATTVPASSVTQWIGIWNDKSGLRELFVSVRSERLSQKQETNIELEQLKYAKYEATVIVSLWLPFAR